MGGRLASERCSFAVCCDSARPIRAIQARPSEFPLHAQHCVEPQGPMSPFAGDLAGSNALFCVSRLCAMTRIGFTLPLASLWIRISRGETPARDWSNVWLSSPHRCA